MFSITVTGPGQQPERYTFDQTEVSIGRVAGNDIVLKQSNISKRHSRLVLKNGDFILIDLKSTNGTLVNGRKITAPQVVTSSDRFSIGDFALQLELDVAADLIPPEPSSAEVPPSAPSGIERLEPRARGERSDGPGLFPMDAVPRDGGGAARRTAPPAPPGPPPGGAGRSSARSRTERTGAVPPAPEPRRKPTGELESLESSGLRAAPSSLRGPSEVSRATDGLSYLVPDGDDLLVACVREVIRLWLDTNEPELPPLRPLRSETVRDFGTRALRHFESHDGSVPDGIDRDRLIELVGLEAIGMGPLELYLSAPDVSEIHVNGWDGILVRRSGRLEKAAMQFASSRSWRAVADRIRELGQLVEPGGGTLRLQGGGRIDLVLPPIAVSEPVLSIQQPPMVVPDLDELVAEGVLTSALAAFFRSALKTGASMILSSRNLPDAATLLEALIAEELPNQRFIVVQEVTRLRENQRHVVRLEQQTGIWPSAVSRGLGLQPTLLAVDPISESTMGDWLMGSASRTASSLLTIPARTPAEALSRIEILAFEGQFRDGHAVRQQLAAMIDLVVFLARDREGRLMVTEVAEVTGAGPQGLHAAPVLSVSRDGDALSHRATGHVPRFVAQAREAGLEVPIDLANN